MRPLDNPLLDALVSRMRQRTGLRIVSKHRGLREMLRLLKAGTLALFLTDQDAGHQGVWAPFLGRPASTIDTPFRLARKYDLPVYVLAVHRLEEGQGCRIDSAGPIEMGKTGDLERDLRIGVARANQALGAFISRWPDQYFGWLHRRWKTPPPPGEPMYDAEGNRLDASPSPGSRVPSPESSTAQR